MIDFERYMTTNFRPLDVIGTTSFGPIAREIWRNTWGKKSILSWFTGYAKRANYSTHTAITCVGKDGRPWLMEMDMTKKRKRYISRDLKNVLLPEEYLYVKHSCSDKFKEVNVFSGVIRSEPSKYFTDNIKSAHVCWIGRCQQLDRYQMDRGNEWLFEKHREGVPYDYLDIIALWDIAKKMKILGSSNIYVCSELVQRCYEHINILPKQIAPMTPMDWELDKRFKEVI